MYHRKYFVTGDECPSDSAFREHSLEDRVVLTIDQQDELIQKTSLIYGKAREKKTHLKRKKEGHSSHD